MVKTEKPGNPDLSSSGIQVVGNAMLQSSDRKDLNSIFFPVVAAVRAGFMLRSWKLLW